ncbi:IS66 family insertion sequence element accessory protein TnpA, partial [Roseimaritima sediminicola]|uniref:IS66 family insertion sequence element accessory protein TnpA n=1 Tax=Roseimaritima sediminicola TaxID=2662066 RepID=UPI0036F349BD
RSRAATRQLWSDRVERFESSGRTVAEFCADEECSAAAFYRWRRKLRPQTRQLEIPTHSSSATFLPVSMPGPANNQVHGGDESSNRASPRSTVMSLELPGGIRVRLEVAADTEVRS